jgi:hypothetical protein
MIKDIIENIKDYGPKEWILVVAIIAVLILLV